MGDMSFVRIENGAVAEGPAALPVSWRAPDGTTYTNLPIWTEAERNAIGWFAVTEDVPAFDPAQQQVTPGAVTLQGGTPHRAWTVAPLPADALYAAKLAAGVQIVSTATPALNGTYAIDLVTQQEITGVVTSIAAGRGLPLGAPVIPWPDAQGTPHSFTAPDFVNFAAAVRDYVFGLLQTRGALMAGQPAPWPAQPSTIP